MKKFLLSLSVLLLVVFFCKEIIPLNIEKPKTVATFSQSTTERKSIGSIPSAKIELFATEEKGNLINFTLQVDGRTISFPTWKNVTNKAYYPELYYSDINNDGTKEIVIVLTTGYGSDVVIKDVHVFNRNQKNNYEEKQVENPISIINKNVETKLTNSTATIKIGDKVSEINVEQLGIVPTHLFQNIAFGSILDFKVIDNKLNAIVGATIAPSGGYIGDINIIYTFKDNIYQMEEIRLVPVGELR